LRTAPLNHPNDATGYRIEFGGKSVCYITDYEHLEGRRDDVLIDLVKDADFMIYDSTYSDEEYELYQGFGHSTWQQGIRVAEEAGVETLVIFHHEPGHDDKWMDEVAKMAEKARPGTVVAQEGMALRP
jgi:phosphoribosyl 1,2-cyclic phosphodiesterase